MSLKDQTTLRVVLYEGAGATALSPDDRFATVRALLDKGFGVTVAANGGPVAPADASPVLVFGDFPDGVPASGFDSDAQAMVSFRSVTGLTAPQVVEQVESARASSHAARPGEWLPWFPVIDFDRCTNCMQCLSFCLFGVYGVDAAQRIAVQSNESCKTNCPACSRVCPEAAIMFPKYKAGPINGDVINDADLQREKMKIDISALLGGDIYTMLRERSERAKSRFSKERDADKALVERKKCLAALAAVTTDVPPEVLMALPSPEEIQRRAEEARAKAQAALGTAVDTR